MSQKVTGNTRSLAASELRRVQKLFDRKVDADEMIPADLAREMYDIAKDLSRRVGVLLSREGRVEEVFLGNREILYLPDLGRYRLAQSRLRRLRLVFSDLSSEDTPPSLPTDIITDLEKLRLDSVIGIKKSKERLAGIYSYLTPEGAAPKTLVPDIAALTIDYRRFMEDVEENLLHALQQRGVVQSENSAVLIHVGDESHQRITVSFDELSELARTAGVQILDRMTQRKKPDPKSILGKGKLEEVVLHCLRLGADLLIFDLELRPGQWRVITNSTELKVLDRSMLILDIFAQRAKTSEGALQVELAQLKYNLPRLVEKDMGLSRLSGGIGGRGPGETKLEIGRRRTRERIAQLERRITSLEKQRGLLRKKRRESGLPLVAIVGYTNVGKSTLFNRLTGSNVIVENKLFATLDPYQRRIVFPLPLGSIESKEEESPVLECLLSDTVGFIRNLPEELMSAFRATLEELHQADVLIHLLDPTDPEIANRRSSVESILSSMGVKAPPVLYVLNKCDQLEKDVVEAIARDQEAFIVSAATGEGVDELLVALYRVLSSRVAPSLSVADFEQVAE